MDKILEKFNKDNFGIAITPLDNSLHLSKNRGKSISQVEYSNAIGSLMYLMSCTRLDMRTRLVNLVDIRVIQVLINGKQ